MALRLKPLDEQVIVLTGASSGIGLVTARMAARRCPPGTGCLQRARRSSTRARTCGASRTRCSA